MIYGVDIGGSKIEIAVFDENLTLMDRWRICTPLDNYRSFISAIHELIVQADNRFDCIGKVGIGMAGLCNQDGLSLSANIAVANGHNVEQDIEGVISRKVVYENDCRCFALSEANGGAGEDFANVYGAIIGTGAAGSFVINGVLLKSRQRAAGEYGHLQLPAILKDKYGLPLRKCGCGLPSCYEGYISGPGLEFLYKHFGGSDISVINLINLWRNKDHLACKVMECYMDILGSCFSNIVFNLDPDIIVLGGGISLVDEIVAELPAHINQHLFEGFFAPPIIRAKFSDASGARGAAILAKGNNDA
jgi:N-acetylglucosamine kinase